MRFFLRYGVFGMTRESFLFGFFSHLFFIQINQVTNYKLILCWIDLQKIKIKVKFKFITKNKK